jgi:hypothetical protein
VGISGGRVAEVLQEMGVLDDDRRPSFESWLERKLDGLAPGIRADAKSWLRTLRDGGPRSRPRDIASAWNHMLYLRPVLLDWSGRYGHLREVTRDDVLAVLGELHGSRRSNVLVALRSLFGFCPDQCPLDTTSVECAEPGYTWAHCSQRHAPGNCWHGSPAGCADLPGRGGNLGGGTVYATREAAEEYLYRWRREQERERKDAEPELKRLRMAMADAHPDRGGTNEEFIAARDQYDRALRQAS